MAKDKKKKQTQDSSFNSEGVVEVVSENITDWQKPDKESFGVLLFATGHPYYGEAALRLAASIKYVDPDVKISLVTDAKAQIREIDANRDLFDRILYPNNAYLYQKGKRVDIRQKVFANEISPYYHTLMLDVDMIWLPRKKPTDFHKQMQKEKVDFTIQNTGFADLSKDNVDDQVYFYWAKISDCKKSYAFTGGKFYQMTGEWVYFTKTEAVNQWFTTVQDVYDNCKVQSIAEFANQSCTDELAYSIASVVTGLYPHKDKWLPVYWPYRNDSFQMRMGNDYITFADEFFAMSVGGNLLPENYKRQYELLAEAYFSKLKISGNPKLTDKKRVIPERAKQ